MRPIDSAHILHVGVLVVLDTKYNDSKLHVPCYEGRKLFTLQILRTNTVTISLQAQ